MENIVSNLKLTESKQRTLFKAHEQLHSEASSFLLFSLQWKDLEQHFDSTRDLILRQFQDLEHREKRFSSKEKQLGNVQRCIDECNKEFELKKNEVGKLNNLIEKNNAEVKLKGKELGNLLNDIKLKEREFHVIRTKNDDCQREFVRNEQKLNGIVLLIEERLKECVSKEKVLESLRTECVSKERDLESVTTLIQEREEGLAAKMKQYDSLQMAVNERSMELKLKGKELESIQNMIATILKEKRLDTIENCINLRTEELDFKEKELGLMLRKSKDLSEELDFKEKELGLMLRKSKDLSEDLSFKESELDSIKLCIKEHSKELDMLGKQLVSTQNYIKDCQNEVICLAEYVSSIEEAIIECSKECESKENLFDSLQTSVDSNELESVEKPHDSLSMTVKKCLEGLKLQKEHFYLLKKSIEDRSQKLEIKETELERQTVELNKKDEKVSKLLKEFEMEKEKVEVDSQMKLLEKAREERRLEEIQSEVHSEELESNKKETQEKCAEKAKSASNSNIHLAIVKTEESDCGSVDSSNTLNFPSGMAIEGKILLALLCEHLKVHDLVRTELTSALQTSSHPAKSVLDAMRWFYPPRVVTGDTQFDVQNVKRGCIFLSELMLKISPKITPPLREEALNLALQWKDKMTAAAAAADNHLEVVAFLLLVVNFGLSRDFNADELHTLLNSVSHYKQVVELGRALGIADKSPVGSTGQAVKMEQAQSSPANKTPISSLTNKNCSSDPNERNLCLVLNEQLTGHGMMPDAILLTLKKSLKPAQLVLDVIQGSFYPQLGFEASSLMRNTVLLKQLMNISPCIDPKVKVDAMKLAVNWKSNMRNDSNISLATVGFLQLLVSYGLTTSFSGDEILKHFENIVLHEQASELCRMFGFTQRIHDLVNNLIGTNQIVEAVRFICGYKLEGFRPVQMLNNYVQNLRNATVEARKIKITGLEEVEAIDKEIDAVKSVITCIANCNLHSEIRSHGLEQRVVALENMKTNKRSFNSKIEPQNQERRNHNGCQPHHPTKVEMQQPQIINVESQQLNSTAAECQQKHPSTIDPGQPQQAWKKKRKNKQQHQDSEIKYPRISPTRPGFSNSTPSMHDERLKFQQYDSRFYGMQGPFGFHENGYEFTEHGNQYFRPPWPRS